jgi:hypothetical protein
MMKEIIHEGRRRDSAWNREVSGLDVAKCAGVHQFGQSQISMRYGIIILKALTLSMFYVSVGALVGLRGSEFFGDILLSIPHCFN